MNTIRFICGSRFSAREAHINALWRAHWTSAVLLTPTEGAARARLEDFVRQQGLPGAWGVRAVELTAFARALVEQRGRPVRMMSTLERRFTVRRVLDGLSDTEGLPRLDISPGLVRHLLHLITQLKQAAVEPEKFRAAACKIGISDGFDRLSAAVYEGYQEALLAAHRYDVPGLYWEANHYCCAPTAPLPDGIDTVLLDGFDDFTPSQQRFLVSLSSHVTRMIIGLNHDPDPDRADLFTLQQQCIESFSRRTAVETIVCETPPPKRSGAYAAQHLFWRNVPPLPEGLASDLRVTACADGQHEIESIARRIKALLVHDKVAPEMVAVALTDIEQSAALVRAVFEEFGIPCVMHVYPPLLSTAAGVFVTRLFEGVRNWDSATITALLTSPLIATAPEEAPLVMAIPLLVREMGVVLGRDAWHAGIERLEQQLAEGASAWRQLPLPGPGDALALLKRRFLALVNLADAMPTRADTRSFVAFLDEQLTVLGLGAGPAHDPAVACRETAALQALRGLFEDLAVSDFSGDAMDRNAFARLLREGRQETRVRVAGAPGPGVRCGALEDLRGARFDHVFVGGLNEGLLPRPASVNAVYSESELHRLRRAGVPIEGRSEHTFRQRMLFHHALCAAQHSITLSWRKQDASNRDALPSPFVVDVMDLLGKTLPVVEPEPGPDCFVPDLALVASPRDLTNVAAYRELEGVKKAFPAWIAPVEALAAIERQRGDASPFGLYDGVIQAPALLAGLAERYGPEAQFSISQLEQYLNFPFQFFISQVLRIRETRTPDGELDPLTRGIVLHDVLRRFHEHYRGRSAGDLLAEDSAGARAYMADCVDAIFRERVQRMTSAPEVVRRVEQRRIVQALDRYLMREETRDDGCFKPLHFETAFGRTPRETRDSLSCNDAFAMDIGGERYLFSGKIDRIDLDGDRARLIDYKSASAPIPKQIKGGLALQLTVYAWAVEQHLLPGVACADAFYLPLFKNKPREALLNGKEEDAVEREAMARTRIVEAVQGIRSGYFPPVPDASLNPNQFRAHPAARYEAWRLQRKIPDRFVADDIEGGND